MPLQRNVAAAVSGERSRLDSNQIISDLQTVVHSRNGRSISDKEARSVIRGLLSYRDTSKQLLSAPRHLFQAIVENDSFYGKSLIPCDTVQLRSMLSDQQISTCGSLCVFSLSLAKKLFRDYACFLILKGEPEDICHDLKTVGGMAVCGRNRINFKGRVSSIVVNDDAPFDEVERIVSDTIPECPIYNVSYIPGLEQVRVAAVERRYVVELSAVNLHKMIVKAPTAEDAVDRALTKRWNTNPDNKGKRRSERYRSEYWKNSGFWDSIVREASIRTSQSQAPSLQLTPEEEQVFSTIMAIDKQFGLGQQYRVAGGWVRDRLLGTQSDDIDIALDKMTGQQFREYADRYAQQNPDSQIGKSYVVDQNPDASKHLETTAIQMGPFKIDFVNLRTEDYASDSRIPEMQFGSPEEDAQRRDLTINALFYNIGTGQVEDYVGGLQDIQSMTLRTPLDAQQTFMDDPLRMLRVLRFHSRYEGSQIAPETLEGMSHPEVHEAYRTKVSPERAGPEIMKLFGGATPEASVRVLYETGMDAAILNLPDFQGLQPATMDQRNPNHRLNWLEHTLKVVKNLNDLLAQNGIEGKDRSLALMGAWFHDFGKLHPDIQQPKDGNPDHMTYHGHEDVSAKLSEKFLKSIGVGRDDREVVNMIVQEHMTPHNYGKDWNKRQMGKFRQKTLIPGQDREDLWKLVMWHAQADAAAKSEDSTLEDVPEYADRFSAMQTYMDTPPPAKPLVDGRRLIELFPTLSPKSGFIRDVHSRLLDEQGAGNITDQAQAEAYVESLRLEIESRYGGGQPMASNWYKKVKIADASSASGTEGYNAGPDSNPERDRWDGVKQMIRYEPGENSVFRVGDRVKRRQVGLGDEPLMGKVIGKKGNRIKVRWDDGDEVESFDLNDTKTTFTLERF